MVLYYKYRPKEAYMSLVLFPQKYATIKHKKLFATKEYIFDTRLKHMYYDFSYN